MIESLLGSTNAERVLVFVWARTEGYPSEIAQFYDTDVYGIQRQLDKFEQGGVVTSRTVGKTRVYRFSPRYAFLQEVTALLEKVVSLYPEEIRDRLVIVRRRPRRRGKPL